MISGLDWTSCLLGMTGLIIAQLGWRFIKKSHRHTASKLIADPRQDYKLVLLIRTDLEMSKGKVAAQCCHATLAAYKEMVLSNPKVLECWEESGQAKITLKVPDEKEM